MALPNKPKGELKAVVDPAVVEMEVDALIVGGGMAACGAAFEIKKWAPADMKILLVDKASLERSGAVAQGLSAINTYIGENPIESNVKMVSNDLMGVVREDLIYDETIFRHPVFDTAALDAQSKIRSMNGRKNTWFAGAWLRHGFHEDGLASARDVADRLAAGSKMTVAAE